MEHKTSSCQRVVTRDPDPVSVFLDISMEALRSLGPYPDVSVQIRPG